MKTFKKVRSELKERKKKRKESSKEINIYTIENCCLKNERTASKEKVKKKKKKEKVGKKKKECQ